MNKSITKNYIYNVSYQILTLILPLITTPYLSRVLGAENLGIYSFTLSIATYFILFGTLGISMYAQREIAYFQDKKYERSKIFWEINVLRLITMIISTLIYYFVYIQGTEYKIYYTILVLQLIATIFDISWFFQGIEDFKKTVTRNLIIKILSIMSIFILVKDQNDLILYFYIFVFSNLIGNISLWLYLPKLLGKIKIKDLEVFKHLKSTISLFIPQIAIQVYTLLNKTMLGVIIDDKKEVGYYDQAQKIISMLLMIVTSLGTVMLPRIAKNFAKGNRKSIEDYMSRSFNFVYFLAIPMIFGLILISNEFVPLFFGKGYEKVVILMNIMAPTILFIGLSNVIGIQYLLPTKKQKEFTNSVLVGALINFIINIFVISKLESVGAAVATLFAEIFVTLIQFYYIRNEFNIKYILKLSFKYIFSGIIMFLIASLISRFINIGTLKILIQTIIGILIYIIVLYILKDDFLKYIFNKVNNIISAKI